MQGHWTPQQARASSNWRELKAVHLALLHFQRELVGSHLLVRQHHYSNLSEQTRGHEEPSLAATGGPHFQVGRASPGFSFCSSSQGTSESDSRYFLGRNRVHQDEWSLKFSVFQALVTRWGLPEVDLFATRYNAKVGNFFFLWIRKGLGSGCCIKPLAIQYLYFSSPPYTAKNLAEVLSKTSKRNPDSTFLAKTGLVFSAPFPDKGSPMDVTF